MAAYAAIDGFYKIIIFQRIQELLSQLRVDGWVVDVMNEKREVMFQSLAAALYRSKSALFGMWIYYQLYFFRQRHRIIF
jgi:hypothetical protein